MNIPTPANPKVFLLSNVTNHRETVLESIADVHASCILRDHTLATFLPPLSRPKMIHHWQTLADEPNDNRFILIYISRVSDRSTTETIEAPFEGHDWLQLTPDFIKDNNTEAELEVAGVVSLSMPSSETGPFRALVQKLFVSPFHRRRGIATQLLTELERQALERGRWSLMLDTTVGTPAEHLYPKVGYNVLGTVKDYGYEPKDRALVDEIFYWKDIRPTSS